MTSKPEVFDPTTLCPRCDLCSIPVNAPAGTVCPLCARYPGTDVGKVTS
jgi:hypothetical protein